MSDRFRDLERPLAGRPKDIVLMATVTGFESLRHPSKSDVRQFAELFEPLYLSSSDEARRQAVAALSRCASVPRQTALFIGRQPISMAAIFLTCSHAMDVRTLIEIAISAAPEHARAIARRDDLPPMVVDALVNRHQGAGTRMADEAGLLESASDSRPRPAELPAPAMDERRAQVLRDERLRHDLRVLARVNGPADAETSSVMDGLSDLHEALLVRFARARDAGLFVSTLADALATTRALSKRILLDASGQQLALTLAAVNMKPVVAESILTAFYPHLAASASNGTMARNMIAEIDIAEAIGRVRAWQRADFYTENPQNTEKAAHEPHLAPDREADPRTVAKRPASFGRQAAESLQRKTVRGR